jgi:hypothetical protein
MSLGHRADGTAASLLLGRGFVLMSPHCAINSTEKGGLNLSAETLSLRVVSDGAAPALSSLLPPEAAAQAPLRCRFLFRSHPSD